MITQASKLSHAHHSFGKHKLKIGNHKVSQARNFLRGDGVFEKETAYFGIAIYVGGLTDLVNRGRQFKKVLLLKMFFNRSWLKSN